MVNLIHFSSRFIFEERRIIMIIRVPMYFQHPENQNPIKSYT